MNKSGERLRARLTEILENLFRQRKDLVWIALRQRAKFEGWLKFELAAALEKDISFSNIQVEQPYQREVRKKADISFRFGGSKHYLQLKTCNTSWKVEQVAHKTRPITKNIKNILDDIKNMQGILPPNFGTALMILFPVDISKSYNEINNRIKRIKNGEQIMNQCSSQKIFPVKNDAGAMMFLFGPYQD